MKGTRLRTIFAGAVLGLCLQGAAQAQDKAAALVEQGKAIATAADCMACHTLPKTGKPFAGGYGIASPLGTIVSTNITPSRRYGIGAYSEAEFARAVRQGIRKDGTYLYPAMPYDAYGAITDADIGALYAYFMQGVTPADEPPAAVTQLAFPFNMRIAMAGWNLFFAGRKPFQPDPGKSEEINRGAYLAGALGHCASCHAPRNLLMGQSADAALTGGYVGAWYAPNITSDPVSGIGGWTVGDLVAYFRNGHVAGKAQAAGGMAEAVQNSLQHLPESDLRALAAYLKSTPAVRGPGDRKAAHDFGAAVSDEAEIRGSNTQAASDSLDSGAKLYNGYCASCHQPDGAGSGSQAYPSLFRNAATGLSNPANLIATILYGVERESGGQTVQMPHFGTGSYVGVLNDRQVTEIANYVLARFGNPEAKVTIADVATARSGGPVPLLAQLQPYMLPGLCVAIVVVVGLVVLLFVRLRHGQQRPAV